MIKCIIIDDEEMARAIIGKLSSNNKNLDLIESFSNAIEAIKFLNKNISDFTYFIQNVVPDYTNTLVNFLKFISDTFYDGLLDDYSKIADSTENEACLQLPAFQPMTFYDIESEESFENNSFSVLTVKLIILTFLSFCAITKLFLVNPAEIVCKIESCSKLNFVLSAFAGKLILERLGFLDQPSFNSFI